MASPLNKAVHMDPYVSRLVRPVTIIIINIYDNKKKKSLAENQHIRMISEGSCDTEDWSNDAEISALTQE